MAGYKNRWDELRERHRPARAFEQSSRVVSGMQLLVDHWQQQVTALGAWCDEVTKEDYPSSRLIPDLITFNVSCFHAALGWCQTLCHPAQATVLQTDEESEMAGPVSLDQFDGDASLLLASDLVSTVGPQRIPSTNVRVRCLDGQPIMVTLVGLRNLVKTLPAGTYTGSIIRTDTNAVVAQLVNIHQRKGPGVSFVFSYSTGID
jgi:hypothetical protein